MLADTCISNDDLVLLQNYVDSDFIPLKNSPKITTSSTTVMSGDGNESRFMLRQSPPNKTESISSSSNSVTFLATDPTLPRESDNSTEKTGSLVPSKCVPCSLEQEGTGLVKAAAVIASDIRLVSDGPSTLILSQVVKFESKATEKLTLPAPESETVTFIPDITLEKLEKKNISLQKPTIIEKENDSPTACYKGCYRHS